MEIPIGRTLKTKMANDYLLSRLQDKAARLREELQMMTSIVESFEQSINSVKQELGFPIGSFLVRGEDEFFD